MENRRWHGRVPGTTITVVIGHLIRMLGNELRSSDAARVACVTVYKEVVGDHPMRGGGGSPEVSMGPLAGGLRPQQVIDRYAMQKEFI